MHIEKVKQKKNTFYGLFISQHILNSTFCPNTKIF